MISMEWSLIRYHHFTQEFDLNMSDKQEHTTAIHVHSWSYVHFHYQPAKETQKMNKPAGKKNEPQTSWLIYLLPDVNIMAQSTKWNTPSYFKTQNHETSLITAKLTKCMVVRSYQLVIWTSWHKVMNKWTSHLDFSANRMNQLVRSLCAPE